MKTKNINCSHIYPSGMIASSDNVSTSKPRVVEHDERIEKLRYKVANRRNSEISGEDVLAISELALELLGGKAIPLNITSNYMTDAARSFLIDSLNFAVTGHRRTSVRIMSHIMEYHAVGKKVSAPTKPLDLKDLNSLLDETSSIEELILRWAKQPNGVFDIICTLRVLF